MADPKKKGRVESGVKYVKNSFAALRTFRDLVDANAQLMQWVMSVAGNREHGTTREAPLKRFVETEQALLKPLPAVPPELVTWAQAKLHGDCHILFSDQQQGYVLPLGYSRQQLTRLIAQYSKTGRIQRRQRTVSGFSRKYSVQDIALLASMDERHNTPCGPALKKLCERAHELYGKHSMPTWHRSL